MAEKKVITDAKDIEELFSLLEKLGEQLKKNNITHGIHTVEMTPERIETWSKAAHTAVSAIVDVTDNPVEGAILLRQIVDSFEEVYHIKVLAGQRFTVPKGNAA